MIPSAPLGPTLWTGLGLAGRTTPSFDPPSKQYQWAKMLINKGLGYKARGSLFHQLEKYSLNHTYLVEMHIAVPTSRG